jgi:hypothetical protein
MVRANPDLAGYAIYLFDFVEYEKGVWKMKQRSTNHQTHSLPVARDLASIYFLSIVVALIMTAASVGSLLFPSNIYPTEELRQGYLANDVVNFVVGLPILIVTMWLTKRGKLIGLLCWPGALLYTFYNYIAYIFGMPFSWVILLYILLNMLSAYAIFILMKGIEWNKVKDKLAGKIPEKFTGGFLVFYGVAFFLLALSVITGTNADQGTVSKPDIGVSIADMVLSALLFIGGILLFRRKPLGYVSGMGLLFAASTLFIGVILIVLLQPVLTNAPFVLEDVIVLSGMALICFIPTGLFMRGVLSSEK